jgi:hypothetical protein
MFEIDHKGWYQSGEVTSDDVEKGGSFQTPLGARPSPRSPNSSTGRLPTFDSKDTKSLGTAGCQGQGVEKDSYVTIESLWRLLRLIS